jgi:predicted TIM-barrel fold metal-dependent hydrolase
MSAHASMADDSLEKKKQTIAQAMAAIAQKGNVIARSAGRVERSGDTQPP